MLRAEYIDGKIVVGKFVSELPVHAYGVTRKGQRNSFINAVLKANGFNIKCTAYKCKTRNKEICNAIGSASQIFKVAHGISCKYMYQDIPQHVFQRMCFGVSGISWDRVQRVRECLTIIKQAIEDGQDNLLPIIVHEKRNPEQLKQLYGKGQWKRLCKNSFSRNKSIVEGCDYRLGVKNTITCRDTLRSSLLYLQVQNATQAIVMNNVCAGKYSDRYFCSRTLRLVRDTMNLVGDRFSVKWSLDKIKQEHDKAVEERNKEHIRIEQMTDYVFPKHFPQHVELGEYKASLISTSNRLYEEGKDMHHCVSLYHSNIARGEYCVYSVTQDGKKFSTIGFDCYTSDGDKKIWIIDQHYKACNAIVVEEDAIALADEICKKLNSP